MCFVISSAASLTSLAAHADPEPAPQPTVTPSRPPAPLPPPVPVLPSATAPAQGATPPVPGASRYPALQEGQHFTIDPVADGVLIGAGGGFAVVLTLILGTGEIRPQTPTPGAANNLLWIDRIAVTQTIDPNASVLSDIGLYTAVAYAALDTTLSGVRDGWDAALVDAVMYGETAAISGAVDGLTKIAVRRPRPIDYVNCSASATAAACVNSTDLSLSFYSGHASTVGALSGTATYLAFQRSPGSVRAWLTLAGGILLTSFVSVERVRSGAHFPTDVIMGSLAGASIGVLVPHLHRHHQEAPPVFVGFTPMKDGGTFSIGKHF